jgi:hypothetical protein
LVDHDTVEILLFGAAEGFELLEVAGWVGTRLTVGEGSVVRFLLVLYRGASSKSHQLHPDEIFGLQLAAADDLGSVDEVCAVRGVAGVASLQGY